MWCAHVFFYFHLLKWPCLLAFSPFLFLTVLFVLSFFPIPATSFTSFFFSLVASFSYALIFPVPCGHSFSRFCLFPLLHPFFRSFCSFILLPSSVLLTWSVLLFFLSHSLSDSWGENSDSINSPPLSFANFSITFYTPTSFTLVQNFTAKMCLFFIAIRMHFVVIYYC